MGDSMSLLKSIAKLLGLYALMTGGVLAATALVVYILFSSEHFIEMLRLALIIEAVVLMMFGIVSILHFSEYSYLRQASINPPMAREVLKHHGERVHKQREFGLLLALLGLTLFLIALFI